MSYLDCVRRRMVRARRRQNKIIGAWTASFVLGVFLCSITKCFGRVFKVTSGPEFVFAISDPSVEFIVLMGDLYWRDSDWEGYDTPVALLRNVTISGPDGVESARETWPLLDMGAVSRKVRLGNGVALRFSGLVLNNAQRTYQTLAPGINLLAPCRAGDIAFVVVINCILVNGLCYSEETVKKISDETPRPPQYPGKQLFRLGLGQTDCINVSSGGGSSSGAPPDMPPGVLFQRRCSPLRGSWDDIATVSIDLEPTSQMLAPNGVILFVKDTPFTCLNVLSDECIRQLGSLGCWKAFRNGSAFATRTGAVKGTAAAPSTPSASGDDLVGQGSGDDGGGAEVPLGPLLGGLLGGIFVLAAAGLALVWVWRRASRRRRQPSSSSSRPTQCDVQWPRALVMVLWKKSRAPAVKSEDDADAESNLASAAAGGGCGVGRDGNKGQLSESVGVWTGPFSSKLRLTAISVTSRVAGDTTSTVTACTSDPEGEPAASQNSYVVVSPLTPPRGDVELGLEAGNQVRLLPRVLGKGAYGKVVEGEYRGARVAVKLLPDCNWAMWGLTPPPAPAAASVVAADAAVAVPEPERCRAAEYGTARGVGGAGQGDPGAVAQGTGEPVAGVTCPGDGGGGATACFQLGETARRKLTSSLAQEVEVLGRCDHPNVVRLLAACLAPPRVCLVMELMGISLDKMMYGIPGQLLPLPLVLDVALDVARGLEYLHPSIVHRDLKPGNILIKLPGPGTSRMVAKLTDFGFARLQYSTATTRNPEVGTPEYMAPELFDLQYEGIHHQADIYSFGVLLWAMLTGLRPWEGVNNVMHMAYRVTMLNERLSLDAIPQDRQYGSLVDLVRQCWDNEPRRRPAAAELAKELQRMNRELHDQVQAAGGVQQG